MSRIYFHSQSEDDVEVFGTERHYMGMIVSRMAWPFLEALASDYPSSRSVLRHIVPPDCYVAKDMDRFESTFKTWFEVGITEANFVIKGESATSFDIQLNTALCVGSDPIKLYARLHGACEIHTFVEGKNRNWLAGIIGKGLEFGVFRKERGWEKVVDLLNKRDDEPVVTSYSVCEQFPNSGIYGYVPRVDEDGEEDWDGFYEIPEDQRWSRSLENLRAKCDGSFAMEPESWNDFYFNSGLTVFDLIEEAKSRETSDSTKAT